MAQSEKRVEIEIVYGKGNPKNVKLRLISVPITSMDLLDKIRKFEKDKDVIGLFRSNELFTNTTDTAVKFGKLAEYTLPTNIYEGSGSWGDPSLYEKLFDQFGEFLTKD